MTPRERVLLTLALAIDACTRAALSDDTLMQLHAVQQRAMDEFTSPQGDGDGRPWSAAGQPDEKYHGVY